ncbi:membrane cofactor protein-like [Saccopteryx leptura]|uniref:membrane cofactor protein-like n=1 Tax=Saccopteryx leptura TaxID=249018 RepID=UPI00339C9C2F
MARAASIEAQVAVKKDWLGSAGEPELSEGGGADHGQATPRSHGANAPPILRLLKEACHWSARPFRHGPHRAHQRYLTRHIVRLGIVASPTRHNQKDACDDPPRFHSMMLKGPPQAIYQPGDRVEYECRLGYKPIIPTRYTTADCQADNTWTPLQEACTMVKCPYPVVKNGNTGSVTGRKYSYKMRVTLECLRGFLLEGSRTVVCGANSTWEPGLPKCTKGVTPTVPDTTPVSRKPGVTPAVPKTTPVSRKPGVKPTVPKTTKPGHYKSAAERFEYLGGRLTALTVLMFLALQ